jgi:Ferric reductase like transmembrane component
MARAMLIWTGLGLALIVPLSFAATSEYLAWRDPIYIAAGFAGVLALCLSLVQPLLVRGWLPGLRLSRGRRLHRATGILLVAAVVIHVVGLWVTSPADVIDALLFRSPTPFSMWGVAAMWAVFAAALLAMLRRHLSPRAWRSSHAVFAGFVVLGGSVHALLIEGTMEPISKTILCSLAIIATLAAFVAPWLRTKRPDIVGLL